MGISTAHSMPRRCVLNVRTSGRRGAQTDKHARKHAALVDVHIREAVHTQRKCTCIHTQLCCCQIRPLVHALVIVENFCARRRARADAHTACGRVSWHACCSKARRVRTPAAECTIWERLARLSCVKASPFRRILQRVRARNVPFLNF